MFLENSFAYQICRASSSSILTSMPHSLSLMTRLPELESLPWKQRPLGCSSGHRGCRFLASVDRSREHEELFGRATACFVKHVLELRTIVLKGPSHYIPSPVLSHQDLGVPENQLLNYLTHLQTTVYTMEWNERKTNLEIYINGSIKIVINLASKFGNNISNPIKF